MAKVSQTDLLVNTSYMVTLTLELLIRDIERRLARENATIQREKKQNFTRFTEACKRTLYYADKLTQDIFMVDSASNWKNIQTWQEESNELARLILLYADKSADVDNVNEVFKLLRSLPGEDIITEEMLDRFRLKTL